ncbi:PstC family ABC transporter permease [Spongorhabdus nitratireducens]
MLASLAAVPPLMVVLLGMYLVVCSISALLQIPVAELFAVQWQPSGDSYGVLLLLTGTVTVTLMALVLTLLIGLSTSLYLTLYARPKMLQVANTALGTLGSLPSVVIGLWAMTWVVPLFGNSLSSAAITAALMIVPTFTLLCISALKQVPANLDENVRALGCSDRIRALVILQHARQGVIRALVLAASRALGEAVAIYLVAGNIAQWPELFGPIATLTTTLIGELDVATGAHRGALHILALLIMLLITLVSLFCRPKLIRKRT